MDTSSISLNITNNCNLACSYCFEGKKNKETMPIDIAKKSIDWLLRDDVSGVHQEVDINFFGGEPLLELDTIKALVPYAREKGKITGKSVAFSITTNGILFTKEVADYWKDNNIGILLSCDGIQKAHDMFRQNSSGKGSFCLVERNFDNILSVSKSKEVRMTVVPQTACYMSSGVEYLNKQGFESIAIFPVEEMTWKDEELLTCQKEFYKIGELIVTAIQKNVSLHISPIEKQIRATIHGDGIHLNEGICGAGCGYMGISVDGTIYPCHRFVSLNNFKGAYSIGNIFSGLDDKKRYPFLRMKKKFLLGCNIECDQCNLQPTCSGGCMAVNLATTGHLNMRPAHSRFHEIIWHEVAKSIIDYFKANECSVFRKRYLGSNESTAVE